MTLTPGWRAFGLCRPAALVLAAALLAGITAPARAADRPIIGVADYYALQPPPVFVLTDPEQYAADVSAGALIRAGGPALTVLPRGEIRGAERKLGWRTHDALNFSRLQALGRATQADRVVVGWITRIVVYRQDFALFDASAAITTQVFDTQQGRIIWQHDTYASGLAGSPDFALEIALDRAVTAGVRAAVPTLSAPVDRTPAP
ncbi:MAG TPA: hypothetical protein VKW09_13020 [bacterium]|nr:hypothetical protein [bacterium]